MFLAGAAQSAHVDMKDPKRALGREDDVRIDAQLLQDTVSPGSPIGVTYQVENLSQKVIALADKVCDVTYDSESHTIIVSVGSEVPRRGEMPHLITIGPGDKKTFRSGAVLRFVTPAVRSPFVSIPEFVEIKVNVLRELAPFHELIDRQAHAAPDAPPITLTDQQFDQWLESNATILLNTIPVRYQPGQKHNLTDASQR
ncbi:MAG: hypothetical protein NVSMB68_05300 [Thermoanaerobaculia bacterium]